MRRLIALLMAATVATPAMAQTALTAPSIKWAGQWTTTSPTSVIGYDSGTSAPCIIGSTATCAVPTSGLSGTTSNVAVPDGTTVTGSITSTQAVTLTNTSGGFGSLGWSVTFGSGAIGLVVVEATVDGTNWYPTTVVPFNGAATGAINGASNAGQASIAGVKGFRFRGNTVSGGTVTITMVPSAFTSAVMQDNLHWSTNVDQINGNTVSAGNGVSGTGVQRVTIASDSTGTTIATQATAANLNATVVGTGTFAVQAAQSGSWSFTPIAITSANASTTITTGGTAQTIAGGTPANGYEVCNPSATEELWVSDLTTAVVNGTGSYRAAPNGGCYSTPTGAKPAGSISVIAATTGHKMTIRTW